MEVTSLFMAVAVVAWMIGILVGSFVTAVLWPFVPAQLSTTFLEHNVESNDRDNENQPVQTTMPSISPRPVIASCTSSMVTTDHPGFAVEIARQ